MFPATKLSLPIKQSRSALGSTYKLTYYRSAQKSKGLLPLPQVNNYISLPTYKLYFNVMKKFKKHKDLDYSLVNHLFPLFITLGYFGTGYNSKIMLLYRSK